MPASPFVAILEKLRGTRFADLSGARITASVPVSERLLNEIVAATLPPNVPVRDVSVRPETANRLSVRLTPKAALLPAFTVKVDIDRQPELPASAVLVLRIGTLPGLFGLAGATLPLAQMLPPGVRLEGERILVDLAAIAAREGAGDLFAHLTQLRVTSEAGRLVVHIEAAVG